MDFQKFDTLNRQYEDIQERLRSNEYEARIAGYEQINRQVEEDDGCLYKKLLCKVYLSKIPSYYKEAP